MLNKKRWSAALLIVVVLCTVTAGPAAADWIVLPNGCLKNTDNNMVNCTRQGNGSSGTKPAADPARQLTAEQIANYQKIAQECANLQKFDQAVQAAGKASTLASDAFYQGNCVPKTGAGDPATAAREVSASMVMQAPVIGMTPKPGPDSVGLVGFPVWLWLENPEVFGSVSAVATLDGVSIGVVGHVTSVD